MSDEETRQATITHLREHLPLEVKGTKASSEMVLEVLVHAAVNGQSIEASCAELAGSADSNTLREHVNEAFRSEMLDEVERRVNEALVAQLPKKLRKKVQELVIDIHDQAFYGKTESLLRYASRGAAKQGTTYFYRIASLYLIHQGLRLTLAVVFVHSGMSLAHCIVRLLKQAKAQKIKLGCLFLDRGFAGIEVYRCLQRRRIPAIIACPIRGKGGGTKALCQGRQSYLTKHTFRSQEQGNCTTTVAVVRAYTHTGQRGQSKARKAAWFLYVLIALKLSPQAVHARYRYRFGIESSYRLMRQVRARTNSRNPVLRFLFMALAFILLNLWLALRFRFCQCPICQCPRRGRTGRTLHESRFRLVRFAAFLSHAIELTYGSRSTIAASVLPLGV